MVSLHRTATSETLAPESPGPPRRIRPTPVVVMPFEVSNLDDEEIVYQPCLLVTGKCPIFANSSHDYIQVHVTDSLASVDVLQKWPVQLGHWKALVFLAPGSNSLNIGLHHAGNIIEQKSLRVNYQPLLQLPPLHLAIMVAKDSPLLIDCPPAKYGAYTSTHNSLDAAVSKFRVTAYMWQALTAEDMRQKGLGRRSFRLEEEWCADTTALSGIATFAGQHLMRSTAKVHIIPCEKTVAEIRSVEYAQQNLQPHEKNALYNIFSNALKASGPPFDSQSGPVVAGLILDSHYSLEHDIILGHAAVGNQNPKGISLGIFGSHLTYSWPRFFHEIPDCLVDTTIPGDTIGNDNGECNTNGQACYVSQGALLREVGHAFGARHTTGIMARGYIRSWGQAFLACNEDHTAKWDLQDCLRFKNMPHFRLPGDHPVTHAFLNAPVHINVSADSDEDNVLCISSSAKLAFVKVTNGGDVKFSFDFRSGGACGEIRINDFDNFDYASPLEIEAIALNGCAETVKNGWSLFNVRSCVHVPGTAVRLVKRSVWSSHEVQADSKDNPWDYHKWTVLLKRRDADGVLIPVSNIDLRVGCTLDGAIVNFADGTHANCGPTFERDGGPYHFGGHLSEDRDMCENVKIIKFELGRKSHGSLDGVRIYLDDGKAWGNVDECEMIETLSPDSNEEVVGLFGTSREAGFVEEFGILTAPKGRVPEVIYDMKELHSWEDDEKARSQGTMF